MNATASVGASSFGLGVCGYNCDKMVGPDMPFARWLIEHHVSLRVGLIPTAVGGTGIGGWTSGRQFADMQSLVHAAMGAKIPYTPRLQGMLWIQGESDANAFATFADAIAYESKLKQFISMVRTEFRV